MATRSSCSPSVSFPLSSLAFPFPLITYSAYSPYTYLFSNPFVEFPFPIIWSNTSPYLFTIYLFLSSILWPPFHETIYYWLTWPDMTWQPWEHSSLTHARPKRGPPPTRTSVTCTTSALTVSQCCRSAPTASYTTAKGLRDSLGCATTASTWTVLTDLTAVSSHPPHSPSLPAPPQGMPRT